MPSLTDHICVILPCMGLIDMLPVAKSLEKAFAQRVEKNTCIQNAYARNLFFRYQIKRFAKGETMFVHSTRTRLNTREIQVSIWASDGYFGLANEGYSRQYCIPFEHHLIYRTFVFLLLLASHIRPA